jgi:ribosome-binding factor A
VDGLNSLASHLRARIGRTMRMRFTPEIAFRLDDSIQRAARIETLLTQVREGSPAPDDADDT